MAEGEFNEIPQPLGMFAGELYRRAIQYLKAAEVLSPDDPELSFPAQFLFAHAIELMLKSYLASQGVTKKKIRSYLHRVLDLYEASCERGLTPDWQVKALVEQIAIMNSENDFRYPSGYEILMPTIKHCLEIITKLDAALSPVVSQAAMSANLDFASATRHFRDKKKIRWSD